MSANGQVIASVQPVGWNDVKDANGWVSYGDDAPKHRVSADQVKAGMWNCCQVNPWQAVSFVSEETGDIVWYQACRPDAGTIPAQRRAIITPALCVDGKCGICADCVECAQVTEFPGDCFQEAMAEAEAEEANLAGQRAMRAEADNDDRDHMASIDTIFTTRATKVKVVHLGAFNGRTAAGRVITAKMAFTARADKVTCKCCPKTSRFLSVKSAQVRAAQAAMYARAGIRTGLVVRQITSGRMGVVISLDSQIAVGYWSGGSAGNRYATVAEFDQTHEIVQARDLAAVGTQVVSSLSGVATVTEVKPDVITMVEDCCGGAVRTYSLSELAAEISRGYLAVVPTAKCPACRVVLTNSQGHEHFGRVPELYFR